MKAKNYEAGLDNKILDNTHSRIRDWFVTDDTDTSGAEEKLFLRDFYHIGDGTDQNENS